MNIIKWGNHKLGDDTAIFNMTTALECPARKKGMCDVVNRGIKCYAEKAEIQYKNVVPAFRKKQKRWWDETPKEEILEKFAIKIKRRRKKTRYLRFNEAGDFKSQEDVDKLSYVAAGLKPLGITTYGYSARKDLDFSNAKFLCKGSSHDKGNNGKTIVIEKDEPVPDGYFLCPGGIKGCAKCNLCKINTKLNIAFRKH